MPGTPRSSFDPDHAKAANVCIHVRQITTRHLTIKNLASLPTWRSRAVWDRSLGSHLIGRVVILGAHVVYSRHKVRKASMQVWHRGWTVWRRWHGAAQMRCSPSLTHSVVSILYPPKCLHAARLLAAVCERKVLCLQPRDFLSFQEHRLEYRHRPGNNPQVSGIARRKSYIYFAATEFPTLIDICRRKMKSNRYDNIYNCEEDIYA